MDGYDDSANTDALRMKGQLKPGKACALFHSVTETQLVTRKHVSGRTVRRDY